MTEATIGGRRSRFVGSATAPGVVIDTWEDLEVRESDPHRTGLVLTFQTGHDLMDGDTGEPNPHVPDARIFAMAYDDTPSDDPAVRFQAAYRQERARAAERLGGPVQLEQVWP
ncbi:hypothetical protein E8D34_13900 [Nocardioides sp. GY 10113]|uniref:hypothetical protein n=1 Tax=Nocardioides sp. GY 10113 TaxID=2569761 RepID=UPI0010A881D3|nr:hypothetical protein [Nocardioides sp. GY 10113]TIC84809.1 hypothetical protein E8D34_13900 [Nocardioides sp. GY 10113]